jgi:hypothetical protein
MASSFAQLLRSVSRSASKQALWGVPLVIGGTWLVFPALDEELKLELGVKTDPELDIKRVQEEKMKRFEAKFGYRPDAKKPKKVKESEDEDDEETEEDEEKEEEAGDEEEENEESAPDKDDEEEDEEEEGTLRLMRS